METELKIAPLKMTNDAKSVLRKQIVRLKLQNRTTVEIEQLTGAKPRHIQLTWKNYQERGKSTVEARKVGRPKGKNSKLTIEQEREIQRLIVDKNPQQLKLKGFLWDRKNIRDLVLEKYKIQISLSTLGYYLARWGFTAQRPTIHSISQKPKAVKKWLEEQYPAIRNRAKEENGDIYWGDETGVQNETNYVKGYAPIGKTPKMSFNPDKRVRINMISAITNQGKLRFMFYRDKMNQQRLKEFIVRLINGNNGRKVFLILDNLRAHHGNLLHEWLALEEQKKRVEIFFLPAYSPEYNPDEYLNGNLKRE